MRLVITATLCLLFTSAALARDIFVSNQAGNDRNSGRTERTELAGSGPVRTIQRALRLAGAGDRIVLDSTGEPYRETLSLMGSRHSGGLLGPLVIEGRGAVLDGSTPIAADAWQHLSGDLYTMQPARLGYQQLFLDGQPAVRRPWDKESVQPPDLAPLEWSLWRGKIVFRTAPGQHPEVYRPSCCGLQTGITLYAVRDVVIRDLLVQGYAVDGVAVHDVARDVRLERVTSCDNGQSGASARGASWVEFDGCRFFGNGQAQVRVSDFARCWLYDCELSSRTAPGLLQEGGEVYRSPGPVAGLRQE